MPDLYETLGVPKSASKEQIKSAYRQRAKKLHPDTGATPNAAAFSEASHAYKLLTDDSRRAHYDEHGEELHSGLSDPIHDRALNLLASVLDKVISHPDVLFHNLPQQIEGELRTMLDQQVKTIAAGNVELEKTKKVRKKLKRKKKDGTDYLLALIDNRIQRIGDELAKIGQMRDGTQRAIGMVEGGYTFEVDVHPQQARNSMFINLNALGSASNS